MKIEAGEKVSDEEEKEEISPHKQADL